MLLEGGDSLVVPFETETPLKTLFGYAERLAKSFVCKSKPKSVNLPLCRALKMQQQYSCKDHFDFKKEESQCNSDMVTQ